MELVFYHYDCTREQNRAVGYYVPEASWRVSRVAQDTLTMTLFFTSDIH